MAMQVPINRFILPERSSYNLLKEDLWHKIIHMGISKLKTINDTVFSS
jgi:hypothetical protein